jgi:hypothetical protein
MTPEDGLLLGSEWSDSSLYCLSPEEPFLEVDSPRVWVDALAKRRKFCDLVYIPKLVVKLLASLFSDGSMPKQQ